MIWAGISKIGKFPLVFIESGVRINAHYYIENVLKPVVKVHGEKMYPNRNWTFQRIQHLLIKQKLLKPGVGQI